MARLVQIIIISIVTACSTLGQTVTLYEVNVDYNLKDRNRIQFGKDTSSYFISSFFSPSYQILLNPTSRESAEYSVIGNDTILAFNKTYESPKYYVEGFYRGKQYIYSSYLLHVFNKDSKDSKTIVFDFNKEQNTQSMLNLHYEYRAVTTHITIRNDLMYFIVIEEDEFNSYIVVYDLIRNKIVQSFKAAMDQFFIGKQYTTPYNVYLSNSDELIISSRNQIIIIPLLNKKIRSFIIPEELWIRNMYIDDDNIVLVAKANSSDLWIAGISLNYEEVRWSYKIELLGSLDEHLVQIYKKDKKYLITPLNLLYFSTPLMELDPQSYENSKVYSFPGKLQDIRKVDDQHFKTTGVLESASDEIKEVIIFGDLYFDNRGECALDTFCIQFDTLKDFTISPYIDIALEDADIILKEADIETEPITFSTSPLPCDDYEYKTEGEFYFIQDTICYSELQNNIEYNKGYYDKSEWNIYIDDFLVYTDVIEVPDFSDFTGSEGMMYIEHYLTVNGCEYFHSGSVYVVRETVGVIYADTEDICPGGVALLYVDKADSPTDISASWYYEGEEFIGSGDSIRVEKEGLYEARLNNGYCEWTEIILLKEQEKIAQSDVDGICPEESAILSINNNSTNPVSASWYNENGNLLGTGDSITVNKPGRYTVELDDGVCQWTESVLIEAGTVGCEPSIYIPSAFTPNEDNTNDTWSIFSSYPVEASIEIYDRWGACIYACEGIDCAWDGKYKDKDMPAGVYVYKLEVQLPQLDKVLRETGTLELIR